MTSREASYAFLCFIDGSMGIFLNNSIFIRLTVTIIVLPQCDLLKTSSLVKFKLLLTSLERVIDLKSEEVSSEEAFL